MRLFSQLTDLGWSEFLCWPISQWLVSWGKHHSQRKWKSAFLFPCIKFKSTGSWLHRQTSADSTRLSFVHKRTKTNQLEKAPVWKYSLSVSCLQGVLYRKDPGEILGEKLNVFMCKVINPHHTLITVVYRGNRWVIGCLLLYSCHPGKQMCTLDMHVNNVVWWFCF